MKRHLSILFVFVALTMAQMLHAEEGGMFDTPEPVGNGAIYNATNQTVRLSLTGNGQVYSHSLEPGKVLLLHDHPKYSVRLNHNRNRIVLNVEVFEPEDNPWMIRWHYITKSRRNMLTIQNGLPVEWTSEIAAAIKQTMSDFNVPARLFPIPAEEKWDPDPKQLEKVTRFRLVEDICANELFKYLNKKLPEYFDDVNDFPFSFTEVYKDPYENPAFLFFMYSGWGSDEILDFISRVGEKTFPNDFGLYHKLRRLRLDRLDYDLGPKLETIASLRGSSFGLLKRDGEVAAEPCSPPNYAIANVIMKEDYFNKDPLITMSRISDKVNESLKDTGLSIHTSIPRKTWWDYACFELRSKAVVLSIDEKPFDALKKYEPRVSICWKFRVTKNPHSPENPIVNIHGYTILHLHSKNRDLTSSQNVAVDKLSIEHFGIKSEAKENCEDIAAWLGEITQDIAKRLEYNP